MTMSGCPATMFRPEIINQLRVLEFFRYRFPGCGKSTNTTLSMPVLKKDSGIARG
jgi:hypothetical protein